MPTPSSFMVSPKAVKAIHRMLKTGGTAPVLHREKAKECGAPGGSLREVTYLSIPKENVPNEDDWTELAWLPF